LRYFKTSPQRPDRWRLIAAAGIVFSLFNGLLKINRLEILNCEQARKNQL
jgi:hypothetical protein